MNMFELRIADKSIFSFGKKDLNVNQLIKYLNAQSNGSTVTESTAFRKEIWVYACINAIARNIARVPFKLYKNNDLQNEVTSGQAYDFFQTVNPSLSHSQLWEGTEVFKQMRGESFWHIIQEGNVLEMEFLDPIRMKVMTDRDGDVIGWQYTNLKGKTTSLTNDEVIHFKFFNPYSPQSLRGLSPLTAAMISVRTNEKGRVFNESILDNGAYPGNVIESEKPLNDPEYERIKQEIAEQHQGTRKAGKPLLLEGGLKYREVKITPQELQQLEQGVVNKSEIHAAFRVHLAITGDTAAFNRANMEEINVAFWTQNLIPEMTQVESILNSNFLPVWFAGENLTGKFDVSVIPELRQSLAKKIESAEKLWKMGVPLNAINEKLNLEFDNFAWGDTWWINFNLVPAGESVSSEPEPAKGNKIDNIFNKLREFKAQSKDKRNSRHFMQWKSFVREIAPIQNKFAKDLKKYMFELRQQVLNNFYSSSDDIQDAQGKGLKADVILFNKSEADTALTALAQANIDEAIKTGGDLALKELGLPGQFEIVNQDTVNFSQLRLNKIKQINDTVFKNVQDIVNTGISEGQSLDVMAENLKNSMTIATNRAKVIARTEVIGAANGGRQEAYKDNGVEKKEWINSFDAEVRPEHQFTQVVSIDKEFQNGLKFPGDQTGSGASPENIINCRCTLGAVVI